MRKALAFVLSLAMSASLLVGCTGTIVVIENPTGNAFAILILRCILGSVFGGGISGLAFSMVGGVFAMTTMCIFKNCKGISIYGVSVLGAAAHNIGQILVAVFLMGSVYVIGYLPYLLLVYVFTGMATGSLCSGIFLILRTNVQIAEHDYFKQ